MSELKLDAIRNIETTDEFFKVHNEIKALAENQDLIKMMVDTINGKAEVLSVEVGFDLPQIEMTKPTKDRNSNFSDDQKMGQVLAAMAELRHDELLEVSNGAIVETANAHLGDKTMGGNQVRDGLKMAIEQKFVEKIEIKNDDGVVVPSKTKYKHTAKGIKDAKGRIQ